MNASTIEGTASHAPGQRVLYIVDGDTSAVADAVRRELADRGLEVESRRACGQLLLVQARDRCTRRPRQTEEA